MTGRGMSSFSTPAAYQTPGPRSCRDRRTVRATVPRSRFTPIATPPARTCGVARQARASRRSHRGVLEPGALDAALLHRDLARKRGRESFQASSRGIRGRPRGRSVFSRLNFRAVRRTQSRLPNGAPRRTLPRSESSSRFAKDRFTRRFQSDGRGTGQDDRILVDFLLPC